MQMAIIMERNHLNKRTYQHNAVFYHIEASIQMNNTLTISHHLEVVKGNLNIKSQIDNDKDGLPVNLFMDHMQHPFNCPVVD